jgi:alpha-mannosidase
MLPANPLLQLLPARLPSTLQRVRALVWHKVADVTDVRATAPDPTHRVWAEVADRRLTRVVGPEHYGKLWDQRWFRLRLPAPAVARAPRYLRWKDQAEATLYIDGQPYWGWDVAHPIAPLPSGVEEVWVESVVCQTAIWHPEATGLDPAGSQWEGSELLTRDPLAWSVWHDFLVLDDLMRDELRRAFPGREDEFGIIGVKPALGRVPPLLRRLFRHLDDAANAFDRGGLPAASRVLAAAYRDLPATGAPPAAVLTGHAHIDLVWMWPERVGEFKAVHTFATAARLLERYPEFRFAYTQPASYRAVARRSAGLFETVRKQIRQGRWEATGAMEVESDTVLPCGEALARSLVVGQEYFRGLTGRPSPVLWLPDVFGYAGCLPQLMRETGVEGFFTTKLTWNAVNAFPYSSFVWAGIDGSEVVAHLCHDNGYNQTVSVRELRRGAEAHRNCDVHPEFLAPSGYGDGGGGVTEEMCERARRVARLAGLPPTGWGRIDAFFQRLALLRPKLPVYRGELYFEYHRGTYTTHGEVKARFRALERALQVQEAAHCVARRGPIDPAVWRRLIFAQFHDYIPGSSVHEVYAEGIAEHTALTAQAEAATGAALRQDDGCPAWFNPLPHPRTVWHQGQLFSLPPLSGRLLAELPRRPAPKVEANRRRLRSDRIDATFNAGGEVVALTVDGNSLALTEPANQLWLYPDRPGAFEPWDVDRHALIDGRREQRRARVSIDRSQVGRASVSFARSLGHASSIVTTYSVEAGAPVLRITYELDWRERDCLLKTLFPTSYVGTMARFGGPFGSVRRPQTGGTSQAEAMWEVPFSRWCVVSDDSESEGLMMVTEAKYGAACRDGVLGLSLIRSVQVTCENRGGGRKESHPESLRRTLAPDTLSDLGPHTIPVAIGRFDPGAPREEQPAALADLLFTPVLPYEGTTCSAGFLGLEGGASLQPSWAQPLPDGQWVLRLQETLGRQGSVKVKAAPGWRLRQVDLSNALLQPLPEGRVEYRPYQVVSIRFTPLGPISMAGRLQRSRKRS